MAKKKRRKQRPEGYDPNEARRQRLEARRQAKAEAMAAHRRAQMRERVIRWVVIAGIAVFGIWFLFFRGQPPDQIAGSLGEYEVQHFDLSGGGEHVETPVNYDTEPPVSGPHSQRAAACGTHGQPIPAENFVHTLEHGAIAITYKSPGDGLIKEIESLVNDYESHVFSAPNIEFEMDHTIAVAAWGHMMEMDKFDEEAIREFIDTFRQGGDSPEAFQSCPMGAQESGAAGPTPTPTPTAEATEAPEEDQESGGKGDKKDKGKN